MRTKISSTYPIPQSMKDIINLHTGGLGIIGILGGLAGPGADLPAIAASWVTMTIQLAAEAGHRMEEDFVKRICQAVATGAGAFLAGTKIASTVFGWVAATFTLGASLAISAGGNAALNAAFTRAYGRACALYFLQTEKIDTADMVVRILMALIGAQLGINMGDDSLIA